MTLNGSIIKTFNKNGQAIDEFGFPFARMSNCADNLLIADHDNNRLQMVHGKEWSMIQQQPRVKEPANAVYDGNALYVVLWELPWALVKYK